MKEKKDKNSDIPSNDQMDFKLWFWERKTVNYGLNLTYEVTDNITAYFNTAIQSNDYANRVYFRTTSLWNNNDNYGGADSPVRKGAAEIYEQTKNLSVEQSMLRVSEIVTSSLSAPLNPGMTNFIIKLIVKSPLNPSIKFAPFIINKKHREIKNNAKISVSKR